MISDMLAFPASVPRETRRLAAGVVGSLCVHLLFVLGFAPKATHNATPMVLQVEIRRETTVDTNIAARTEKPAELAALRMTAAPVPVNPPQHEPPQAPAAPEAPIQLDLPLDKYYSPRDVDVRAEQINEVHLLYPQRPYMMRIQGKVVLRIFINEHGGIDDIAILHATPAGTFEEAALTATQALQFRPAVKNGRNVKSEKTIEVIFDPYESINIP